MIEVDNIRPINKGSLLATCDVRIVPWKLKLREVKIFEKGQNRWIKLPCKEVINDMQEKIYIEMIVFDTDQVRKRFSEQVMDAVNKYLESNPSMAPPDVITNEEIPF